MEDSFVEEQLESFPGAREDVLTFIASILYREGYEQSETIRHLFHAGYCYYFALMLKDAFGGEICWHKGHSHIVWRDTRDSELIVYDCEGVFYDYNSDDDIVPISFLGANLESFRHRGHDTDVINEIKDAAQKQGITDKELKSMVYNSIPKDWLVFDYYNDGDVYRYWNIYKKKYLITEKGLKECSSF